MRARPANHSRVTYPCGKTRRRTALQHMALLLRDKALAELVRVAVPDDGIPGKDIYEMPAMLFGYGGEPSGMRCVALPDEYHGLRAMTTDQYRAAARSAAAS